MDALKRFEAPLRRPAVQSALLGAASFVLLLAFHHTVAHSVRQADQRRHADTRLAIAAWQCNSKPSPGERRGCLGRLGLRDAGPSAGCEAVTPDGSACTFSATRRAVRPAIPVGTTL